MLHNNGIYFKLVGYRVFEHRCVRVSVSEVHAEAANKRIQRQKHFASTFFTRMAGVLEFRSEFSIRTFTLASR